MSSTQITYDTFCFFFQIIETVINEDCEQSGSTEQVDDFPLEPCYQDSYMQTEVQPLPNTIDKSIDNSVRAKSVRTQYNCKHFANSSEEEQVTPAKSVLKVKVSKPKSCNKECNTDLSFSPTACVTFTIQSESPLRFDEPPDFDIYLPDEQHDESFHVEETSSSDDGEEDNIFDTFSKHPNNSAQKDCKFIVFWSCLLPLLRICLTCNTTATVTKVFTKGSMVIASLLCSDNHVTKWYSQPHIGGSAAGNILLAASILYSGNTFTRIKEMMNIANIQFFSHSIFVRLQRNVLFPAVNKTYKLHRNNIYNRCAAEPNLHVIGDGRCDSPGYNAKYGTYTLMDSNSSEIIDFHIVYVSTAGNSA